MNRSVYIVSLILIALAVALICGRLFILQTPLMPKIYTSRWQVEARIQRADLKPSIKIQLSIPPTGLGAKVIEESIRSSGLAAAVLQKAGTRTLVLSGKAKPRTDTSMYYSAVMETGTNGIKSPELPKSHKASLKKLLSEEEREEANRYIKRQSKLAKTALVFVRKTIDCVTADDCKDGGFLQRFRTSEKKLVYLVSNLAQLAGYRTYIARGFVAERSERVAALHYWLRVYDHKNLVDIRILGEFDTSHLIFWDYPEALATAGYEQSSDVTYSLAPIEAAWMPELAQPKEFNSLGWRLLSLRNVPVSVQAMYRVLLMIPIGALVISVLRSIVGLQMFGTFMPILIALAFRETGLEWGIALLCLVVTFGLLTRSLLKSLRLLLVPRLAASLSIVILLVIIISRMSFEYGFSGGLSVTLFPIIIITMIIERMSISWEEVGPRKTLILFTNSLLSAILCYSVMMIPLMRYWMFVFPELIFIILALLILIGRYKSYRLLELYRFRSFA